MNFKVNDIKSELVNYLKNKLLNIYVMFYISCFGLNFDFTLNLVKGFTYLIKTDTVYIKLNDRITDNSIEITENIIVDVDNNDKPTGIEILNATNTLRLEKTKDIGWYTSYD